MLETEKKNDGCVIDGTQIRSTINYTAIIKKFEGIAGPIALSCKQQSNYVVVKCDLCMRSGVEFEPFNYLLGCSKCTYNACKKCIEQWYVKNKLCPQCKAVNTFEDDNSVSSTNKTFNLTFLINPLIKRGKRKILEIVILVKMVPLII